MSGIEWWEKSERQLFEEWVDEAMKDFKFNINLLQPIKDLFHTLRLKFSNNKDVKGKKGKKGKGKNTD